VIKSNLDAFALGVGEFTIQNSRIQNDALYETLRVACFSKSCHAAGNTAALTKFKIKDIFRQGFKPRWLLSLSKY
jgi:hypothetical protein